MRRTILVLMLGLVLLAGCGIVDPATCARAMSLRQSCLEKRCEGFLPPAAGQLCNAQLRTDLAKLRIPCKATGGSSEFDQCPSHLPVVAGQKMVAYDVAAWSDLWFYSNPIYIEVAGGTTVAGVK